VKAQRFATNPAAWAICPTRFLLAFAQGGLLSPLLPLLRDTFQVSYGELGLLTSAFGLSAVGMDLIATRFLSCRPLLHVLLQGICLTGLGLLCCALAPGFYWLVGARVLLGFGVSMARFACLTVMVTATARTAQGRAHNLLEFSAIAGSAVSPLLSGLIATAVHWRAAYGTALLFVAGACTWVLYSRQTLARAIEIGAKNQLSPPPRPTAQVAMASSEASRTALLAYVSAFVLSFTWAGFLSTALPLFGGDVVGLSTATLGVIMTAGLCVDLVLLLPIGWLSDRLQGRIVLGPALLLMAAALVWLPQATTMTALLLISVGLHAGFATWGIPSAALAVLTRGPQQARAMALYRLLVDGGAVLAPGLVGMLIERYGYGVPTHATAVVVALTALLVLWGARSARRRLSPRPV
jgi:FSR family fosmidomycin resistance protein-like MFS transporter